MARLFLWSLYLAACLCLWTHVRSDDPAGEINMKPPGVTDEEKIIIDKGFPWFQEKAEKLLASWEILKPDLEGNLSDRGDGKRSLKLEDFSKSFRKCLESYDFFSRPTCGQMVSSLGGRQSASRNTSIRQNIMNFKVKLTNLRLDWIQVYHLYRRRDSAPTIWQDSEQGPLVRPFFDSLMSLDESARAMRWNEVAGGRGARPSMGNLQTWIREMVPWMEALTYKDFAYVPSLCQYIKKSIRLFAGDTQQLSRDCSKLEQEWKLLKNQLLPDRQRPPPHQLRHDEAPPSYPASPAARRRERSTIPQPLTETEGAGEEDDDLEILPYPGRANMGPGPRGLSDVRPPDSDQQPAPHPQTNPDPQVADDLALTHAGERPNSPIPHSPPLPKLRELPPYESPMALPSWCQEHAIPPNSQAILSHEHGLRKTPEDWLNPGHLPTEDDLRRAMEWCGTPSEIPTGQDMPAHAPWGVETASNRNPEPGSNSSPDDSDAPPTPGRKRRYPDPPPSDPRKRPRLLDSKEPASSAGLGSE